ncbi:hypothetical protein [Bradyrhizobium sp. CIR3A]|uniref:hypothetical protein n=1 Tax=Bradyrhizobium sp. CIR3A TaxID=2663838 RepID=UPI001605F48F|nr:hypothetical protein [Bradyrhizobium sp. CIR3A]MBB4263114.1 hypothetical protein [Bradyrhizobium sp. CIR3A]
MIVKMIQYSKICPRELLRIGCDLLLDESRRGGLIISPFNKLLCVFILEQSPKLPWRELLCFDGKLLWIKGKRGARGILPLPVELVTQFLFQLLKLLWREGNRQRDGFVIEMIHYAPKLLLRKLRWIDRDLSFKESRRDGLIILPRVMLLLPISFVRRAVLCSGAVDAYRFRQ